MYATMEEYQALERVIDQLKEEFAKKDAEIAEKQATIEALGKTNKDLLNDLDKMTERVFQLNERLQETKAELSETIDFYRN